MNLALVWLICVGALFHPHGRVFLLFGVGMLLHWWWAAYITSDMLYYVSDAIMLVCIAETLKLASPTGPHIFILSICGVGVITDAAGVVLWINYNQPLLYNSAYTAIYLTVLCKLVGGRGRMDADAGSGSGVFSHRTGVPPCRRTDMGKGP